jgi:GeoRSP system PqqD family protein
VEDVGTSVLYLGGTVLSLNILGTEIWKLCDGRTVDEIVASLLQSFEVEPDVLDQDVRSFLQELKEKGFIHYEE